jgi:hypothetical protein
MLGKIICVFRPHKWLQITSQLGNGDMRLQEFCCTRCGASWGQWKREANEGSE